MRIPIHGRAESLNLAAAAAVVLFESARQRAAGDGISQ
jgi:tRNA G18 (ribose-2'-O)-methylase SpoU